jgi:hypothetical protein
MPAARQQLLPNGTALDQALDHQTGMLIRHCGDRLP